MQFRIHSAPSQLYVTTRRNTQLTCDYDSLHTAMAAELEINLNHADLNSLETNYIKKNFGGGDFTLCRAAF